MKETATQDKMEALLSRAFEIGTEKAKVIDTSSVVVEDWVIWKCQYGCPLYDKDALHPPCAPGPGSTMELELPRIC